MNTSFSELGLTEPAPEAKEEEKKEEEAEESRDDLTESQKLCSELAKAAAFKGQSGLIAKGPATRHHFYHYVPQFRLVMQLEQVIGVAEKSSLINSLFQDSLHPQKLQ